MRRPRSPAKGAGRHEGCAAEMRAGCWCLPVRPTSSPVTAAEEEGRACYQLCVMLCYVMLCYWKRVWYTAGRGIAVACMSDRPAEVKVLMVAEKPALNIFLTSFKYHKEMHPNRRSLVHFFAFASPTSQVPLCSCSYHFYQHHEQEEVRQVI